MRSSKSGTVHIVGAGLAGLAAAVRLTQSHRTVAVHEATAYAGGRCRSYHDSATDMLIDNGTHLLLSGNHAALSYVGTIGSSAGLHGPKEAEFPFIDLANGKQWTLRFGESRFPWWVFDRTAAFRRPVLPTIFRSRGLPGQRLTSRLPMF
jgi:monoamine oxidase